MFSIRVKITAITILAILTSILTVVIACNVTIQEENDRNSVEMMNLVGQNTQQSVENSLESIEQSVEMAGNLASDSLDSIVLIENGASNVNSGRKKQTAAQKAELDAYLKRYCDHLKEDFASIASYTPDIVTYYYCISPEVSENEHGFFYSRAGKTGFDEREPLVASQLDPDDIEHNTWYFTPIQRGRPSWIGPYRAKSLNEMMICSYLVPIYKANTMIGVLGMDIPLETLIEHVSSIRIYDHGFASLLDENGRVLYHPELKAGTIPDISGRSDLNEILEQDNSGNELIRYTTNDEERQMYFSTLSNGMKLFIAAPEKEITASWIRLTHIILIDAAVIILVFALLVLFGMGVITRPLKLLTDASARLADGDYDVELNYKGRDEVGKLTNAFTQMRDHMKEYIEDLNRRIRMDDLTGTPNMRYFFQLANEERQRLREEGETAYILYFNMIGMKDLNRQYGFGTGDRLICEVSEILTRHFGTQLLSHFGRDHFAAITCREDLEEELRAIFREVRRANEGKTLPIQAGIYLDEMPDVEMSAACDRAKFACDQLSGSYVSDFCYFDGDMLEQVEDNRYFTSHLERALEENWIQAYYQPIIRAGSGRVCDVEALSRWIDPEKGLQPPDKFIPVLERARLIHKLDLYMLDQILKKMQIIQEEGIPLVPHSLNISREDFDSCDIVEEVRRRVDASGMPREKIQIEITESMVGEDFDFMKEQIRRFQSLGFQVWMDDFGSGYSALDVLQDIHFDLIKMDMRFLNRFEDGDESRIILTKLLQMAKELDIETVVEGVETEEQVQFLKSIGATKLQGYYYCRPISLEEIEERYRNGTQIGYDIPEEDGK